MNSELKNYPMKEFRAIFSISSILVKITKKRPFYENDGIYINLGCNLNSECKNYPMKEFRTIFFISSILVIRSGYAKKDNFSILAVIQNIWDLHKFGLQIWIQNVKITLFKNFGQFFRFHQFWSKCMRKKPSF